MKLDNELIKSFERNYNSDWENEAEAQRGAFLRRFPLDKLKDLTLEKYVIGSQSHETFCYWIEPGTCKWARIVGSNSFKFGVYYGKTKSDSRIRYRYTKGFARGLPLVGYENQVFENVRNSLLNLVKDADSLNFSAIDANPLSQMIKAKVISLYFPDKFINLCSKDILEDLDQELELAIESHSQIQHELAKLQFSNTKTRNWTRLKFVAFLYRQVLGIVPKVSKSRLRQNPDVTVDFDKLQAIWKKYGKMSEKFALEFEKDRLLSCKLNHLTNSIVDYTKKPRYGYDFRSFSSEKVYRCIEVKTLTNNRFYLSANELEISKKPENFEEYYFYLVTYEKKLPIEVKVIKAASVYKSSKLVAQNYLIKVQPSQFIQALK